MKFALSLIPFALLVACASQTQVSPEKAFKMADADGDGLLTRSEATDMMIENAFKRLDTDGSGILSEEEYVAGGGKAEGFRKADTSGSGGLSLAEVQANPAAVDHMAMPFDEADVNDNGAITLEEFLAYKESLDSAVR